ncbi:MAG: glycosyltransferase [Planctomycetes bacterium]|nr:glycosyltransferase [Planctomycetota bacterium]
MTPPRANLAAALRESFTLAYVGQFRETRVCDQYLAGIAGFLAKDANRRARFRFRVVGQMSPRLERRAIELNVNLSTTGYLSHLDAVREMCAADLLLLSTVRGRNGASVIPGKVFEYLATGRPILAIGDPESEVIRLIERMNAGVGVPRDAASVAEALARYWSEWQSGKAPTGARAGAVASYSRETLTARLAGVFELAIESARIDRRESQRLDVRAPVDARPVPLGTGAVET